MVSVEECRCVPDAALLLGLTPEAFAALGSLTLGRAEQEFRRCSPATHQLAQLIKEGIVPIFAKDTRKDYAPAPEGLHQAVCVDIVDLGIVSTQWGDKHKVRVVWQIEAVNPDTGKPFTPMQQYTLSLNEKARLRQHLEAWRGRKFTSDELSGFDLEKLLGANCQLQLVHSISDDGRTFSNVQAIVPLGRGMTKIRGSEDYVRVKDRVTDNGDEPEKASGDDVDDVPF